MVWKKWSGSVDVAMVGVGEAREGKLGRVWVTINNEGTEMVVMAIDGPRIEDSVKAFITCLSFCSIIQSYPSTRCSCSQLIYLNSIDLATNLAYPASKPVYKQCPHEQCPIYRRKMQLRKRMQEDIACLRTTA